MWKLNSQDLLQLKGGGGEPFVHFMDRLIFAEAACRGLAPAEIVTQLRANIKDGGVDTEVKKAMPQDRTGWFTVPTCWQFKAVDAKDIDDKKKKTKKKNALQQEINKPYAKELIEKGYGYRLCLLGDLTPQKLRDWEAQLKGEANAINAQAPDPRVVHGTHLLDWAGHFPAIIAYLCKLPEGVFHWETWAANCQKHTRNYVPNSNWDGVRRQILEHVQFGYPCVGGEPCLFIGGAAGVGKTRLVFESLSELPHCSALVVIVEDEQEAKKIGTWLANADRQFAILVADECSPQARYFLNENLRGHVHRVRVVSIDNTGEPLASGAGRVSLSPADALKNTEEILSANFPHVPEDRRRRYGQFSRGFVRLAADMCEHDAEMAAGQMSGVLRDVERYARHRLGTYVEIVSIIALFHKLGFRDDVAGELESLCQLTAHSKQQFHDAVRAIKDSPGFVVQTGRYWYVTPEIVARVLFNEGWERWVSPDLEGFLKKLPEEMRHQVVERVATHARKEVRDQVGTFFRAWFSQLTAPDLADQPTVALASALTEVSPDQYLPQFRAVIEAAKPGELRGIEGHAVGVKWGPRRTLVWLLERLVSFPEFFEDCEACLFRLAVAESELEIANNATGIWANLFSVYLSGTAAPFDRRMSILQRRTSSSVIEEARLGFTGVAKALQHAEAHILGEPVVAGRLRPEDWRPVTVGERMTCYRSALKICGQHLNGDLNKENHRLAFHVLADSLYFLLGQGLADDLRGIVTPQNIAEHEARKLVQIIDDFMERMEITGQARINDQAVTYIQALKIWSNLFRPSDFAGKLRSVCARPPWDQRFAEDVSKDRDETDELAGMIVQQPALLGTQLDWLASPEAQSAERLGFAVGRIDLASDCGRMILEHAIDRKAAPLLRGYIRGMVYTAREPTSDFLKCMTKLELAHPELAIDILVYAGDAFDALNRILRIADSQTVSAKYLANLAMGLGRRKLTVQEVNRVLPYFARAAIVGDAESALAGVRFLETYLLFESRHSKPSCLMSDATRSLAWQVVEGVMPFLGGQLGYEWGDIVKKLAVFDRDHAAHLLAAALLAENIGLRHQAERELIELAKSYPESVMKAFGLALVHPERGWLLQVDVCRELLGQIPPGTLLSWVREHGMEAAKAIARHLPRPHLDEASNPVVPEVLDTILREFDDDDVFVNFLGGSHSGEVWWGNGADQFRHAAEDAKKFLNHPNRRIREWAKHEMSYRQQLAELEQQEDEERFLPL